MLENFDYKRYAPELFIRFIENNKKSIPGMEIKKVVKLSLHSVFLNIDRLIIKPTASEFAKSFTGENSDYLLRVKEINTAVQTLGEIITPLKELKNKVVLIRNLEVPVNSRISVYTKKEQLRELVNYIETDDDNIYIIPLSDTDWQEFIALEPRLRILFQHEFRFEGVSAEMLIKHLFTELGNNNYKITKEALSLCREFFIYSKRTLPPNALSLNLATVLFREACYYHALRTSKTDDRNLLMLADIEKAIEDEYTPEEDGNYDKIMADFDELVGLENIKSSIFDLSVLIKVNRMRSNANKGKALPVSLNALFTGNPGTGKTTIANILGKIYKSIGALPSGHVVAVGRQDIVGQFIGDTEMNMKEIIAKARGGILFIDEAYALYKEDNSRDFGQEAINVLVDSLEKIREHTCVILAGYPEQMTHFLTSNEGLSSRFPHNLEFADYSLVELYLIFCSFLQSEGLLMENGCSDLLTDYLKELYDNKDKYFGNARECRNLFEKLKLIQARRIAATNAPNVNLYEITKDDIIALIREHKIKPAETLTRKIGFELNHE